MTRALPQTLRHAPVTSVPHDRFDPPPHPLVLPPPDETRSRPRYRRSVWTVVRVALLGTLVLLLPFVVLVRSVVYFYAHRGFAAWLAIGAALGLSLALVSIYAAWASFRLTGRVHLRAAIRWVALPLVALYGGYSLLYLSQMNAKGPEVLSYYRSLHPVLRVALSTLVVVDRHLVITDLRREPADYAALGLPAAEASLHYPQPDGYVHALDLRTIGRSAWRNVLVAGYFRAMGFRTLRHVGTADHLHVALPPPG